MGMAHKKKDNRITQKRKEAKGLEHGTDEPNSMDKERNKVAGNI
jgi:hypothetical protein